MIDGLKRYPEYKDSGVPWLGDVPEHWEVIAGRVCLQKVYRPNVGLVESTVLSLSYGQIIVKPKEKLHGLVPASFETYQIVEPGEIVCRPTDLQNDQTSLRFGRARCRGIITSAYICLKTHNNLVREYGYLLLHAYDLKKVFYGLGSGLRQNLDWRDFKNLPCLLPPLPEQTAIVRFLDWADSRIRRVIRARKRRIKLLEEYKQALINQAVTGKIDVRTGKSYPKYKNSGVEWLGKVPEHWEVRRLRQVARMLVSNVDKHTKEGEIAVRLCNYLDVYKNERITADIKFMLATAPPDKIKRFRLRCGDVAITKDSEIWNDIGVPALIEYEAPDLVYGYHLAILRPYRNQLVGLYLLRALQSQGVATQLHVAANGVTRFGLSHNAIKNAQIPVPPLSEQTVIVEFLDEQTEKIDATVAATRRVIELLGEFRTRLIADVVTGKLDVREAAARLSGLPNKLETKNDLSEITVDENDIEIDIDTLIDNLRNGEVFGEA